MTRRKESGVALLTALFIAALASIAAVAMLVTRIIGPLKNTRIAIINPMAIQAR